MKNVYIVRHGESGTNFLGVLDGALSPLTDKGIRQAKIVAKRIAKLPNIQVVISSDMLRARQTASEIARFCNLPIVELAGIHESMKPSFFMV